MAQAGAVLSWPGGLVLWFVKLNVFAVALSLFEVSTAKMRVFRVPEFLGVAMLLGLLSAIFFVRCGAARRMTEIYPLAHLLGGLMLLCAFALLSQRRLSAMITIYQVEALVLSAAAFWQGFAQHAAELYLTGVITMSIKGDIAADGAAAHRAPVQPDPRGGNRDAGGIVDDPGGRADRHCSDGWCCRPRPTPLH